MRELSQKVFKVDAVHTGGAAAKKAAAAVCGVEANLLLAKGARVMLRSNAWTSKGLTNGAMGTLVDVIAPTANKMPICALVRFDEYNGPTYFPDDPKVVPIAPHTAQYGHTKSLSRTNLPLCLAWAITIHKSQGATYDRAVINLGSKEIALGLTYVALSRVKTLEGILLVGNYSMDRIMRLNLNKKHRVRDAAEEWLDTLPGN